MAIGERHSERKAKKGTYCIQDLIFCACHVPFGDLWHSRHWQYSKKKKTTTTTLECRGHFHFNNWIPQTSRCGRERERHWLHYSAPMTIIVMTLREHLLPPQVVSRQVQDMKRSERWKGFAMRDAKRWRKTHLAQPGWAVAAHANWFKGRDCSSLNVCTHTITIALRVNNNVIFRE